MVLALATAVAVAARSAWSDRYREERRAIELNGAQTRTQEIAASWKSFTYTEASSGNLIQEFLSRAKLPQLELSQEQNKTLTNYLAATMDYLLRPSFDKYFKLKTEGLTFRFEPSSAPTMDSGHAPQTKTHSSLQPRASTHQDEARRLPVEAVSQFSPADSSHNDHFDPRVMVQERWQSILARNGTGVPAHIAAICLEHVAIAVSHTNSVESILKGKVAKGLTVASIWQDPGFRYGAIGDDDSVPDTFVQLSFFARSSTSTNAGPVHLSVYWSEPDRRWVMSRMITDALLNMHLLF